MDDGIKQRLIGAVVLLALVVIFLPVLFDRETLEPIDRRSQIPPAPELEVIVVQPPQRPQVASPAPPPKEMFIPEGGDEQERDLPKAAALETEATKSIKPKVTTKKLAVKKVPAQAPQVDVTKVQLEDAKLDEHGVPSAWVIQVATFSEHKRAVTMRDELIKKSHPAYIREVVSQGENLTRVYVGPKLNRSLLEKVKSQIDKEYQIKSLILQLNPEKK